jgi:hypothetical protein
MQELLSANEKEQLLKWADYYTGLGWPIIPVGANKKPLVSWKEYQSRLTTHDEVEGWLQQFPTMTAIGVATGAFANIVVVDVEVEGDISPYEGIDTVRARSGGRGNHFFFNHPGYDVPNSVKELAPYTDIRGDGGYIVLSPSKSEKGSYEWVKSPEQAPFAELPQHVIDYLKKSGKQTDWSRFAETDVTEGNRNNAAASYAGYLLGKHGEDEWEGVAWPMFQKWNNEHCKPSLKPRELQNIYESIKEREHAKPPQAKALARETRPSPSTRLVESMLSDDAITLFRDQYGEAFVHLPVNEHMETWPCDSREFRRFIARAFYTATEGKETLGKEAINGAINTLEGKAIFDGDQYELHVRAAKTEDGAIWYDLGDDSWRAVRITDEGWRVVDKPPILFRRFSHGDAQVVPEAGGKVEDVLKFVNVTDSDQKMLFQVYLVSTLIPGFPHPMPFVFGPQGSAKSSFSRIVRRLIDPSKLDVVSLTRHEKDLILQLDHQYLLFFDNVSEIPDWIADLLCRAITGAGVASRLLYTNSDESIRNIRTNIGINGINLSCNKPDLLERSILFELDRLERTARRPEDELYAEFEAMRPKLLGALFDAVSKALALRPNVQIDSLPRMADFASYGYAIAEAIGIGGKEFLAAYHRNINSQSGAVIDDNTVATLIREIAESEIEWIGTATTLHAKMRQMMLAKQLDDRALPATPSILSREVNKMKAPLEDERVFVGHHPTERRVLIIRAMPTIAVEDDNEAETPCP